MTALRCPRCGGSPPDAATRVCTACSDTVYLDDEGVRGTRSDALLGRVLDRRFALVQRIAVGGMGALYRAVQLPIERTVAIKVIRPELLGADADVVRGRFRREAQALSRLRHPHSVTLFDFGETPEGELYMAMELIEGPNLEQALRDGPVPADRAIALVCQAAQALEEAHRLGVVHRDLKPANIMLADLGDGIERVKVVDFGIARLLDTGASDRRVTLTGKISGTPHYMSPEVVRGGAADHRSDIYALGLILYRMIAGRPPFDGSPIQVVLQQMNDPPPPLAEVAPEVTIPRGLDTVIDRALRKRPDERYATVGDLRRDLEAVGRRSELGALWAEAGEGADALFSILRAHADRLVALIVAEVRAQVAIYRRIPPDWLEDRVRFYVHWCLVPVPDEDELARFLDRRWRLERQFFVRLPDLLAAFASWFPALRRLAHELSPEARAMVERHMGTLERHVWLLLRITGAQYEQIRLEGGEAGTSAGRLMDAVRRAGPVQADELAANDAFAALAPRRATVTVLVAALVDPTGRPASLALPAEPAVALAALRRRVAALRDAVTRWGGLVQAASADAFVAVFGAPVAHEDDAHWAVRAGLEALADVKRIADEAAHLRVRVGITTGEAVTGDLGGDERPCYGAAGEVVTRSAALCGSAAPDEVVVDALTRSRLRSALPDGAAFRVVDA
jgi:class 3 adenylate cyclase